MQVLRQVKSFTMEVSRLRIASFSSSKKDIVDSYYTFMEKHMGSLSYRDRRRSSLTSGVEVVEGKKKVSGKISAGDGDMMMIDIPNSRQRVNHFRLWPQLASIEAMGRLEKGMLKAEFKGKVRARNRKTANTWVAHILGVSHDPDLDDIDDLKRQGLTSISASEGNAGAVTDTDTGSYVESVYLGRYDTKQKARDAVKHILSYVNINKKFKGRGKYKKKGKDNGDGNSLLNVSESTSLTTTTNKIIATKERVRVYASRSGIKGVTYMIDRKRWRARTTSGKRTTIGYFHCKEEAAAMLEAYIASQSGSGNSHGDGENEAGGVGVSVSNIDRWRSTKYAKPILAKSGFRGVYHHRSKYQAWARVSTQKTSKGLYLGRFVTPEEAAQKIMECEKLDKKYLEKISGSLQARDPHSHPHSHLYPHISIPRRKLSSSGFRGVYLDNGRWRAYGKRIGDRKPRFIGSGFATKLEAVEARNLYLKMGMLFLSWRKGVRVRDLEYRNVEVGTFTGT